MTDDPLLADYARKLRWALSALPEKDRDDIVAEMRSHVLDRVDAGASLKDALAALGSPEEYARGFADAHAVASALSSRRTPHMISALATGAARNVAAAGAGILILLTWVVAALISYVAILKISDPTHVGLWKGGRNFFIGIIDDPSTAKELLGPWITPLALVVVILAWLITRALAVWALRRLAPRA